MIANKYDDALVISFFGKSFVYYSQGDLSMIYASRVHRVIWRNK